MNKKDIELLASANALHNVSGDIHTARPGVVIGKKGEDVEKLRAAVAKIAGVPAQINIAEVRKPELDAQLVGDSIASQQIGRAHV